MSKSARPSRLPVLALCHVVLFALQLQPGLCQATSCDLRIGTPGTALKQMEERSCAKVYLFAKEVPHLMAFQSEDVRQGWEDRAAKAVEQCDKANSTSSLLEATQIALTAWGDTFMGGRQCCNSVVPPFCVTTHESRVVHLAPFAAFLIAGLIVLLSPCCFKQLTSTSFFVRGRGPPPLAPVAAAAAKRRISATARALVGGTPQASSSSISTRVRGDSAEALRRHLEEAWMGVNDAEHGQVGRKGPRGSPLRALPGAAGWASATADLFVLLWRLFDFQQDSVKNQFEHLLSLWRSHAAMVADRASEGRQLPGSGPASEGELLSTALRELHAEVLEGFCIWRDELRACREAAASTDGTLPLRLGGTSWPTSSAGRVPRAQELLEVSLFLLVWGEAGNLRFMPEVLYFLTELSLAAATSPRGVPGEALVSPGIQSCGFLARVVRPIYNLVFDESHERVGIDVPLVEIKWGVDPQQESYRLLTCRVTDPSNRPGSKYKAEVRLEKPHGQRERERFPASQQWLLDPVGYTPEGQRLFRIRWAADRNKCLQISAWSSQSSMSMPASGRQVQLRDADESDDGQVFVHDVAAERLIWQEEVPAPGGEGPPQKKLWRLGAVGHQAADTMRVQLQEVGSTGGEALKVEVKEKRSGKDAKQLRKGFESFFPPDAANYDDWNEIFCKPQLLTKRLVLLTGDRLFDLPHGERFSALRQVNWRGSLAGAKTHRELHSYWGAFASTHRVWLLHELAFANLVCWVGSAGLLEVNNPDPAVVGKTPASCFAAAGLMIPFHSALWHFALWCTLGPVVRERRSLVMRTLRGLGNVVMWSVPVFTYVLVRLCQAHGGTLGGIDLVPLLILHFAAVACGAALLLLSPGRSEDEYWQIDYAPYPKRVLRWVFWTLVFGGKVAFGLFLVNVFNNANKNLLLPGLLQTSFKDINTFAFTAQWDREVVEWFALWGTGFMLFLTDTQLWFTMGCTIAGVVVGTANRQWRVNNIVREDAIAKIPERFSQKVLPYDRQSTGARSQALPFAPHFPVLWDRIVEYMRYEDKLDDTTAGELTFIPGGGRADWASLSQRLPERPQGGVSVPRLFGQQTCAERYLRRDLQLLPDDSWPRNPEVQWRLSALARGLSLKLPRPFRAPHMPGITVLIPHYGEAIIMAQKELWVSRAEGGGGGRTASSTSPVQPENRHVQLISWLEQRYSLEFAAFTSRMRHRSGEWHGRGRNWQSYNEDQWLKLCVWASMRNQTLLRTVAGMSLYHNALDCHHAVQGDKGCSLGQDEVWDPEACFTCLVAMQQYAYFNKTQLEHVEWMFNMFPPSLKVAFIDSEDKGPPGDEDNVHPGQQRRYFSCLIDRRCDLDASSKRRKPRYRIELPGFPILGDGKGDNQNTALPFSRGQFIQCIDANQGGYFEQMLLLPCALGEFRNDGTGATAGPRPRGRARPGSGGPDGTKKIIGLPEHITSDIGSIGDFAASAEFAFGTVLQRAHAALGGRMHYGHPDIMAKAYMMQQGGVSKATKTVNLSEDIFAGMDFSLRGGGRSIAHREYLHLTKGRDMGFATVLQFFSKLSAGAGEVVLTRQSLRLGQLMPLPEFLTFYYAHVGFYLTQYFISRCPPTLMFLWLLVVLSSTESNVSALDQRTGMEKPPPLDSEAIVTVFSQCFSPVVLLFLVAQAMPYIVAVWSQQGILVAIPRYLKQLLTLSPLHFIFQAKVIGIYVTNELRVGGAQYIATGRGLPIDRRPFISERGGLYQDFVQIALYDGARLLGSAVLVLLVGGGSAHHLSWWWVCLALTIVSWLYAPFIFNPYQFAHRFFKGDLQSIREFFTKDGGGQWEAWYERTQLRRGTGLRVTIFDLLYWFFFVSAWYTSVNAKLHDLAVLFPKEIFRQLPLLPPVFLSFVVAAVCACIEPWCGRKRSNKPGAANLLSLLPLAGLFVALDLLEVLITLIPLGVVHWWKACGAAVVLKYSLLSLILNCTEQILRLNWCCGYPRAHLRLWLYAHRMAMDALVSSLIFWTLAPLVLFDRLREKCCMYCSFHHLLVFRDPGQQVRDEATLLGDVDMRSPLAAHNVEGAPPLPVPSFEPSTFNATGVMPYDQVAAQPPSRPPPVMPPAQAPARPVGTPPQRRPSADEAPARPVAGTPQQLPSADEAQQRPSVDQAPPSRPVAGTPQKRPSADEAKPNPQAADAVENPQDPPSVVAPAASEAAAGPSASTSASDGAVPRPPVTAANPTPASMDSFEEELAKSEDVVRLATAAAKKDSES